MRGRRWAWLAAVGALTVAGVAVVALGPEPSGRLPTGEGPLAPAMAASTLPTDVSALVLGAASGPMPVLAPFGSATGATGTARGQSVVSPGPGASSALQVPSPTVALGPETVRTADVRVNVAAGTYNEAFDRAASTASTHGGYVASSASSFDEGASAGHLVLRVPVERFDAARRDIAELGELDLQAIRGQDVSAQLVDHEARLRSLQVQEDALRSLVGKASTVGEVLQVQPTLTNVRLQIEQLQAQRGSLERAAALATIVVTLREPGAPDGQRAVSDAGLGRRVEQAVDGALAVLGGMIVALGWAMPVLSLGAAGYLVIAARRALHATRA